MATEDVVAKGPTGKPFVSCTYYSLNEYADAAAKRVDQNGHDVYDFGSAFAFEDALKGAREGWPEQLDETLEIVESAIALCEKEHEIETFTPVWDVTGSEVDVARYLTGEPECMIDYPLAKTSKVGKVITLCASMSISGAISAADITRRGQTIVALAMVITQLGHSAEIWLDDSTAPGGTGLASRYLMGRTRVLVKGANDTVDPARIMFAFAHPGSLRGLGFAIEHGWPKEFQRLAGPSYGGVMPPLEDLPEGTIYLPELRANSKVPDPHAAIKSHLGELGLLAE